MGEGASRPLAVLGAGPAGLTAGYVLARSARPVVVFEADAQVGGLARTVVRDGYRFDLGGHRFFTKSDEIQRLWEQVLNEELLVRDRMSRIYLARALHRLPAAPRRRHAQGRPRRARALRELLRAGGRATPAAPPRGRDVRGVGLRPLRTASVRAVLQELHREGLGRADDGDPRRVGRPADPHAVVLARRARRGAQRRRRRAQPHRAVSLPAARPRPDVGGDGGGDRRSGRPGPARRAGRPPRARGRARRRGACGRRARRGGDVISSLALRDVVALADPPAPAAVRRAARGLRYRDFLTVALVIDGEDLFPDNWIYIHDPQVRVGRIQNFRAWSEAMVPDAGAHLRRHGVLLLRGRRAVERRATRSSSRARRASWRRSGWRRPRAS